MYELLGKEQGLAAVAKFLLDKYPHEVVVVVGGVVASGEPSFYLVGFRYDDETELLKTAQQQAPELKGVNGDLAPDKKQPRQLKRSSSSTSSILNPSTWGSHREGLHSGQSGRHFLEALEGRCFMILARM